MQRRFQARNVWTRFLTFPENHKVEDLRGGKGAVGKAKGVIFQHASSQDLVVFTALDRVVDAIGASLPALTVTATVHYVPLRSQHS